MVRPDVSRWVTRREGKASDYEILVSRLIDRALRPLFPDDYHAEVFVNVMLMSADSIDMPDALAGWLLLQL
jgi:polyribonucleotide nucleotidyltransferase